MQARTLQRLRIAQRTNDAGGEFVFAPRQRCETTITCVPIPGRRIDQHHLEFVLQDAGSDLADLKIVGKCELDRAKPGVCRFAEALEKRNFRK